MTRLEFNEFVEQLAERYEGRPGALARATAVWIALGYVALFAGLVAALVGGFAMMAFGLWLGHQYAAWLVAGGAVVVLVGIGMYGRLLWTPRPPVKELVLKPDDAPALMDLIEDVRRAAGCRAFHRILLEADVNASVRYEPRFGILGGARTSLYLGLPLMEILTPEEFRAVLAHEFVHHSKSHGRFSVWVYRVRTTWETLFRDLESGQRATSLRLARWFLRWYWPRMNARAFLLCRQHEFQADRFAAEHAGADAIAMSLWRIENSDRYLDVVLWPEFNRLPEQLSEPPRDVTDRIATCLSMSARAAVASWCAETTHARLTDSADTHPCWLERTEALGATPASVAQRGFPRRPAPSAADSLLGSSRARLAQEISSLWAASVTEAWKSRHHRLAGQRRRLRQIRPLLEARPADVSLRWEEARLVQELDGNDAARPLLVQLRELSPQHRGATFELGQAALAAGDPSGEALLEEIVQQQRDSYYDPACTTLGTFYRLTGRFADMRSMEARLDGRDAWSEWIREGHRRLAGDVRCQPHGLTPEQLAALVESLRRHSELAAAWLVRVGASESGAPPLFVLCVSAAAARLSLRRASAEQELARRLIGQVPVPGRLLVIARHGADSRLARRVLAVSDSQLFPVSGELDR